MKLTGVNYRHGDLGLFGVDTLPDGLTASTAKVLMVGSGGNDHSFGNGTFYPGGKYLGYLVAKKTKLYHPDHGAIVGKKPLREAALLDGIYELRRQVEDTHDGMKEVVD